MGECVLRCKRHNMIEASQPSDITSSKRQRQVYGIVSSLLFDNVVEQKPFPVTQHPSER